MDNQGTIEISCTNQDYGAQKDLSLPAHKFIKIAIKDDGCGISEKNISKIFDPYFSTKEKSSIKGSGLGLALAHSIIAKHNGFIRAESQDGKGSTFTIFLPVADNRDNSYATPVTVCHARHVKKTGNKGARGAPPSCRSVSLLLKRAVIDIISPIIETGLAFTTPMSAREFVVMFRGRQALIHDLVTS
jgi:hypothetical protein